MIPLHDENPVARPPIVTWLILAACVVAYFFWQPGPLEADAGDDRVFFLENAAIPCELVERRPLDVFEADATYRLGYAEACDVDGGNRRRRCPARACGCRW
jgi:hypothetical protein